MKITATKIKTILVEKYGWETMIKLDHPIHIELIKDTLRDISNKLSYKIGSINTDIICKRV